MRYAPRDFMALGEDHCSLLDFIFQANDAECSSRTPDGTRNCEFKSVRDHRDYYGMTDWITFPDTCLSSYYIRTMRAENTLRADRHPSRRGRPATFRYAFNGWACASIACRSARRLARSLLDEHNSEGRASHGAMITNPQYGSPSDWNWKAVSAFQDG